MRHDIQVEIIRRFFKHADDRTTDIADAPYRNDAAVYTDPAHVARERDALFRGHVQVAGLSCDLPSTGLGARGAVADLTREVVFTEDFDQQRAIQRNLATGLLPGSSTAATSRR